MKISKKVWMQLQRAIMQFATVETDQGTLSYEGELEVGKEVFLATPDAEPTPAPDGDYKAEGRMIKVADGKVAEIVEDAPAAAMEEMSADETIAAFASAIEKLNTKIEAKFSALDGELKAVRKSMTGLDGKVAKFSAAPAGTPIPPEKKSETKKSGPVFTGMGSFAEIVNANPKKQ